MSKAWMWSPMAMQDIRKRYHPRDMRSRVDEIVEFTGLGPYIDMPAKDLALFRKLNGMFQQGVPLQELRRWTTKPWSDRIMSTVAVVLCNYNHAKYLPDSLGHICAQTRPADQIVVIDDGSTDDSWRIIEEFARKHSNLQAHANERNLGLETCIARALALVHCEYLLWTAADDRLLPPFLERNMALLARHPAAALSFSEVVVLKGDSEEIDPIATNSAAPRTF